MKKKFIILILTIFQSITVFCQADTLHLKPGRIGIGAELGPCTGKFFLTGDADKKLNSGWCYANVGITGSFNKIYFAIQMGGLSSSQKADLTFNDKWKENNGFTSTNFQLLTGYHLLNKRHFNIIPFVTLGTTAFNTLPKDKSITGASTNFQPSYSVGAAYDLKLNFPVKKRNQLPGQEHIVQYMYLRLLSGVYPTYFQTQLKLNGAMYYINLSIGCYIKGFRKHKS
jgi:hypothetical protein